MKTLLINGILGIGILLFVMAIYTARKIKDYPNYFDLHKELANLNIAWIIYSVLFIEYTVQTEGRSVRPQPLFTIHIISAFSVLILLFILRYALTGEKLSHKLKHRRLGYFCAICYAVMAGTGSILSFY